jgi:hypothetical protein
VLDLPEGPVRLTGRQLRELRRLAAKGRPHPDRDVRRRAVAWARRPALSPGRTAATVVTGTLGAAALVAGAYYRAAVLIVLVGLPLTLISAALAAGPPRAALIHRVNLAALLDDMAVPARPLEVVGPGRRRRLHQLSVSGVLVADAVAGAVARAYSVTLLCLVVAVVAFVVGRVRDAPTLPVRLDETGLRLSGGAVSVPWTGVDAVELASSVDPFLLVVRWRLPVQARTERIPGASPGRAPGSAHRLDLWVDPRDHPPETIVLTSRAYLAATPPADDPTP